jgi:glycosyltransferase involved in cell wall biosynthesis
MDFRNIPVVRFNGNNEFETWLTHEAGKIDVFCVIEPTRDNIGYIKLYKKYNQSGIAYLKMDINDRSLAAKYFPQSNAKGFLHEWRRKNRLRIFRQKLKHPDIISTETMSGCSNLEKIFDGCQPLSTKILYLPNGFDTLQQDGLISDVRYERKENLLISVGRIGTYQKKTELLLEAIADVDLRDWNVCFIGPIEDRFRNTIARFFSENPKLLDKVRFIGNVTDKKELCKWYARAKVFILTSRWEGFPLVFPEALHYGNYIVTTNVSGAVDITDHGKLGAIISDDSPESFKEVLSCVFRGERSNKATFHAIVAHGEKYSWRTIIPKLHDKIMKLYDPR